MNGIATWPVTACAKQNRGSELRVYGVLSDRPDFYFFSYDPVEGKFQLDEKIAVNNNRVDYLRDMIKGMFKLRVHYSMLIFISLVTNKLFSTIFYAFLDGIDWKARESKARGENGDVSSRIVVFGL